MVFLATDGAAASIPSQANGNADSLMRPTFLTLRAAKNLKKRGATIFGAWLVDNENRLDQVNAFAKFRGRPLYQPKDLFTGNAEVIGSGRSVYFGAVKGASLECQLPYATSVETCDTRKLCTRYMAVYFSRECLAASRAHSCRLTSQHS